jgi:hypothetical protein
MVAAQHPAVFWAPCLAFALLLAGGLAGVLIAAKNQLQYNHAAVSGGWHAFKAVQPVMASSEGGVGAQLVRQSPANPCVTCKSSMLNVGTACKSALPEPADNNVSVGIKCSRHSWNQGSLRSLIQQLDTTSEYVDNT